ncbi:MAG: hypothetical protein ACTH2Y_04770 [Corynebacterium sp.]|uniref:hypothetical protein n=1 Tax=unclassified Corynebacterium TaxID=2624378 RepID=UPI00264839B3|nr:hypothetical protein [Corynebacterium sp.]MDN5719232.1 hypothetical protein [Corynebacterium sp.]MDN6258703.1 hypothetical protein [Corynebacterium sp.]MDN6324222.1 hypothetical protein [Corynebacterium sp.]MDN6509287.1 hypothetical protein [Corynebacterium sp.]
MAMFLTCMILSAAISALVTWLTMWLVLSMEEKSNGTIEGFGRKRRTVQQAAAKQLDECRHVWGQWETIQEEATAPFTVIQRRECELCRKRALDRVTLTA